jgi:hypothetical protein
VAVLEKYMSVVGSIQFRELEVPPVEAVVDAEDEVRAVLLQHVHVVALAEGDRVPVDHALELNEGIEGLVHPGGAGLDLVVEIDPGPVDDGRLLQHLLDPHVDVVAVELEAPVRERLRAGVMAAAGAGRQD